jgi:hypothetical protein
MSSDKADYILSKTKEAYDKALPVVKMIAALTPTRADDVIIMLFEKYAVPNVNAFLILPEKDRGPALLEVATTIVEKQMEGVDNSIVKAGVQFAVVQLKAANKQTP